MHLAKVKAQSNEWISTLRIQNIAMQSLCRLMMENDYSYIIYLRTISDDE